MNRDLINGRLMTLFFTGLVMLNYPILSLFNHDGTIRGIPILYCYIFAAWFLVIGITLLIARSYRVRHPETRGKPRGEPPIDGGPGPNFIPTGSTQKGR